jgi:peptidoglycan/xylan/chitin deacetylase (PgdA/CDA1 family)
MCLVAVPLATCTSATSGAHPATASASRGTTGTVYLRGQPVTEASTVVATPSAPGTEQPASLALPVATALPAVTVPPPSVPRPPMGPPPTPGAGLAPRLLGRDWDRIPTDRKIVALTFDAGANADGVGSILATLAREHVPATFFLTGQFADSYPAQTRLIATGGFRLGNHSATHPSFPALGDAAIRDQVLGAEHDIRVATGGDPRPLFRFPFGDRDQRTITALVAGRVLGALTPGEIVLMHLGSNPRDHSTLDADALAGVIEALRDQGYGFVTLASLLT